MSNLQEDLKKTVVLEYALKIADSQRRNLIDSGKISVLVDPLLGMKQMQQGVSPGITATAAGITSFICITAYGSLVLSITNSHGTTSLIPCSGTFLFFGQLDSVTVSADTLTPVSIIWA